MKLLPFVLSVFLLGSAHAAPPQPASEQVLSASPAPVWRFDGEDYYLVDRQVAPGSRVLAFLQDGTTPESCARRLWLRKVGCKDLRAYELNYTRRWDASQRDVRYRSPIKLVHSGWVQEGGLTKWKLMHWRLHGGALYCVELELLSRPPSANVKQMSELVRRQQDNWYRQISTMAGQAASFLDPAP